MALPKVGVEAVIEGMAKFEADSKKVNKSLADIGTGTSRLGTIASSLTSKITSLVSSLAKIGAVGAGVAIAGIGAGLYTAVSAGLSFNNTMEQAEAKINAFTKDADLTAQMLEQIRLEAAKTPFAFDEMANSFAGLIPAAKQADVEVMDLLRDAEILAASNPAEGLVGATFALREAVSGDFTSIIERFNLPRSMINKLKEEGLPALEIVRTAMKDMGYDMDLVTALANTAEGRWSTFKDTLTNLAGTVTQPLFDALSGGLGNVNNWLTLVSPQLEAFAQMLAGQVAGAIEAVVISVNKVAGAFQRFGVRGAAVSILGQLGLEPEQIAQVMSVVDQVTGAIDKISGAFERFGARGAAVSILGQLGVAPETIGLVRTTFDTIVEKIGIVQQVFAQFGAMGAGVSLLSILGLSSENIALITTGVQTIIDTFTALSTWWVTNWPIMQAVALTAWEVIQGIFIGLQTALGPSLTQLQAQFTQVFNQISDLLGSFGITWSDVWSALATATGIVAAGIGAAIVGIIGIVAGLAAGIAEGISAAITMFQGLATNVAGIFTGLTTIFVGWVQTFKALLVGDFAGAWEGFKIVLDGAVTFWTNMWGGMITVAVGTLDIITSTISGFVEGIVGFFQGLYNQLVGNSIVTDLMNAIVRLFTALPGRILAGLGSLTEKVTAPFIELSTTIKEELTGAFNGLIEEVLPLMVEGFDFVTEGVKNFISSIREAASTLADMVVPDWLQMHSPPPMATAFEMIATSANLANQAVAGMLDSLASNRWDEIRGDVLDLVDDMQDEGFYASRGFGKSTGFAIKQAFIRAFTANFQGILSGTVGADALLALTRHEAGAYAERVTGDFGKIIARARAAGSQMLQELKQELLEILPSAAGGLSSVASQFVEMLEPQMGDRAKFIKKMQDFLASGSDELFRFDFAPALAGTDHVMLNRLRTQEQLNYLLAEQRKQEIEITKQKEAQQKLSFLQAQIDLIKIGRELGGNIFQGITFGLHADAEDLLAATNRVVEAMIGQIHTTLEIGSPSQIMVEVGQQIMAGLQRGIVSMTPTLNAQLSASVMGPLSPMMAGALSAGNQNTTVHNWNVGGNNFYNQTDDAVFEAKVMRAIRRNL